MSRYARQGGCPGCWHCCGFGWQFLLQVFTGYCTEVSLVARALWDQERGKQPNHLSNASCPLSFQNGAQARWFTPRWTSSGAKCPAGFEARAQHQAAFAQESGSGAHEAQPIAAKHALPRPCGTTSFLASPMNLYILLSEMRQKCILVQACINVPSCTPHAPKQQLTPDPTHQGLHTHSALEVHPMTLCDFPCMPMPRPPPSTAKPYDGKHC